MKYQFSVKEIGVPLKRTTVVKKKSEDMDDLEERAIRKLYGSRAEVHHSHDSVKIHRSNGRGWCTPITGEVTITMEVV